MDRSDFEALEQRVRSRANDLWNEADRPDGGAERFIDQARELVALAEVPAPTLPPRAEPVIEEAALQRNLGEFPTLVDQGEEQTYPDAPDHTDDGIGLSDGDASDQGGVLPDDLAPTDDVFDVAQGEADVTSSALTVEDADAPRSDDRNDGGMADHPIDDDKEQR